MIEAMKQLLQISRQMLHEIGREPTPEELAEKLGMPLERVRKVLEIAGEPLSLDMPIGEEEDSRLSDFVDDDNAVTPLDSAVQTNLREDTAQALARLTPREERIMRMRFGIGMESNHTLEEVGNQFSATRQRIRQIEAKALRKLTRNTRTSFAAFSIFECSGCRSDEIGNHLLRQHPAPASGRTHRDASHRTRSAVR